MEMQIDCPQCNVVLNIPESAAGRAARCPKCRTKFRIPTQEDMLEETVSHWIVDELEKIDASEDAADGGGGESSGTLMGVPAMGASQVNKAINNNGGSSSTATASPPAAAKQPAAPAAPPEKKPAAAAEKPAPAKAAPAPPPVAAASSSPPAEHTAAGEFPSSLRAPDRPYLVVKDFSQSGVVLAFNYKWLEVDSFRASMPRRCAFSGSGDRKELLVRPMIFLDKFRGSDRSTHALETTHEIRLTGHQSVHDALMAMRRLDDFITPFDSPLIYFVNKNQASMSLKTKTYEDQGTICCEVIVPDSRVALEWLARVNGVCGPEFDLLESEVSMQGSDAWRQLSGKIRDRLAAWAQFQPHEHFRLYLKDADFTSADAGLAGVVITDQRLIYHKYHHSGEIPLQEQGVLHVKTDGRVARLSMESGGDISRIGKISMNDMSKLIEQLSSNSKLKIELASGR